MGESKRGLTRPVRRASDIRPGRRRLSCRRRLEAAFGILIDRGGEDLSMRAMASRAAFSRASLYANFSGKEKILAALAT